MTFHNPEYLFLLLLLIPIVFWYIKEMHKSDASLQISSLHSLLKFPKSKKIKFRHVPFVFRVLAISFIIIALSRPQASNSWRTQNTEGIDIMMAIDISGTMLAEDLKPNRLEASKDVASEFILSRPNDNIGLVVFAGESFTQCPLTIDHAVLINLFKGVNYGMIEDGERDVISNRKDGRKQADDIGGITGERKNSHLKKHSKKPDFLPPLNMMKSNSHKSSISSIKLSGLFEQLERIKKLML